VIADADVVAEAMVYYHRTHPCPLKTCGCVASMDKMGALRVGHPWLPLHPGGRGCNGNGGRKIRANPDDRSLGGS